ncbi:hypothetical protein A2U01_0077864, partial [Trifolium medium]|nr:hypothetical protein [Trifolium medium]
GVVVLSLVTSESRYGGGGDGHNRKVRLREIHQVQIEDAEGESLDVRFGDETYASSQAITVGADISN